MTNEEFMRLAQLQKANAEYAQHEQVKDWFLAAFLWVTFIAASLVLLALFAFSFLGDFGPTAIAPTTGITLLLLYIACKLK